MDIQLFNEIIQKQGFKPLNFIDIGFPGNQYERKNTKKKTFILHYSSGWDNARGMYNGWEKDKLGRVSTAYGIEDIGEVYRGFDASKYYGYAIYVNSPHNHLPKNLQQFKTKRHDILLNSQAIQVEICNWGWLREKNNNFFSWTGHQIANDKVVIYKDDNLFKTGYRGQHYYEKITDAEIKSLEVLMFYHAILDDIPLKYNHDMWDISERAIRGAEGIWSHTSYRTDKLDIHPQQELVSMLMRVEDDFKSFFNPGLIRMIKAV